MKSSVIQAVTFGTSPTAGVIVPEEETRRRIEEGEDRAKQF